MNRKTGIFVTLLMSVALVSAVVAGTIEAPFELGTWENFAKGAISHGFDDNMNTNPTAQEQTIFDPYKFHITLHVQTGSMSNWANCKTSFAKGHEISSHSVSHPQTMPVSELSASQKTIKTNVPGEMCVTVAYPNCNSPGQSSVLQNYIAGRNCNGQVNGKTPGDFSQVGAVGVGSGAGGYTNNTSGINAIADQAVSKGGWAVCMHHGIGSQSHNWATTSLDAMKGHLKYLDENRDKIWMETFGNVARYIKERDAASLTVKSSEDAKITVSLTDNLPDSIYDYPLTLRRPIPDGWSTVFVSQAGKLVDDSILTVGSTKYVMFKAVPDSGDIILSPGTSVLDKQIADKSPVHSVVINRSSLTVNTAGFSGSSINVSLFDLKGGLVAQYSYNKSVAPITVPINTLANFSFVVKITDGKTALVRCCLSQM